MQFKQIPVFEASRGHALIAAHRGVCGANLPCNTLEAYALALRQGAEIVEIDVTKTTDDHLYVFHPYMEPVQLGSAKYIHQMTAAEASALRYLNCDRTPTHYPVATLDEVLELLKGKCYVNVDKFWMNMPEIVQSIRRHGMEQQVLVKTPPEDKYLDMVEQLAPDMPYLAVIAEEDTVSARVRGRSIRYAGAEVIFRSDDSPLCSEGYIRSMHEQGLILWINSIIYNEKDVLSGGHHDDGAVTGDPDKHWGWMLDKGFDVIQTDWTLMLRNYIDYRCKEGK